MEITTRKVLTNAELLDIMEKKKKEGLDEFKKSLFSEENSIKSDKLYSYLKDNCELSLEKIAKLSQDLSRFELDKLEKLQILNLLPVTEAELLLMIREGSTRFTSDELNTICALVVQAKNK